MSRSPQPTGRGSGGVITSQSARPSSPEHERDVVLAQDARRRIVKRIQAKRLDGETVPPSMMAWRRSLDGILRDLARSPWNHLTQRQRELCARTCGLETVPATPAAAVPEVLRVLPKKPPRRVPVE